MQYKGYEAMPDFGEADRTLHDRVPGTHDVISFEADSVDGIEIEDRDPGVHGHVAVSLTWRSRNQTLVGGKIFVVLSKSSRVRDYGSYP